MVDDGEVVIFLGCGEILEVGGDCGQGFEASEDWRRRGISYQNMEDDGSCTVEHEGLFFAVLTFFDMSFNPSRF